MPVSPRMCCPALDGLAIPRGTSASIAFTICGPDRRTPISSFVSGDAISASIWPGDDYEETFAPTATWVSEAAGTAVLDVSDDDSDVAPGDYRLVVNVAVSDRTYTVHDGLVAIGVAPGSVSLPAVYCGYDLMRSLFPAIDQIRDAQSDTSGFVEFRGMAKREIDFFIVDRYDPRPDFNRRRAATPDPIYGFDVPDLETIPPTKDELRTLLSAGALVLPEPDAVIVETAAARLTIALVLARNAATSYRPGVSFADVAGEFRKEANRDLAKFRAHVDTDDDQVADILVDRDVVFLT